MQQHYARPTLTIVGSFRDVTQVGFYGAGDGCTIVGPGISATGNNFQSTCGTTSSRS
ncbi:MAG: lasso RiPP family leader peptide-containing protein [Gemmatimonadota bacterium]